jgi:chemotaxis protein MotB
MNGSRGSGWWTFFLLIAVAGIGYLAYHLYGRNRSLDGDLGRTRTEALSCSESLQGARTRSSDMEKQLLDCTMGRGGDKVKQEELEKLSQDLANNMNATKAELEDLRKEHADAAKRLALFKTLGEKLQKMIDAGKLSVGVRRGQMIVKLPAEVLFASGSAQLSPEGQAPLRELAAVLKQFPDRRFMVAGHTDNVPIVSSSFKSNWELSTARAVTVTEFLASAGMNPAKLVAAGYSEYDPVRPNTTDAGRGENRRIEIVLLPNVTELTGLAKAASAIGVKTEQAKPAESAGQH